MSSKPFVTIQGCKIEIGLDPASQISGINYWERITTPDGHVLRNVSQNIDIHGIEDDPIELMVLEKWTQSRIRKGGRRSIE